MAAAATDILSLSQIKSELRISSTVTDQDTLLTGQIEAAASWAALRADRPWVDETTAFPAQTDDPITLYVRDVRSVTGVDYWLPAQRRSAAPAGEVTEFGGLEISPGRSVALLWPVDEWPDHLPSSPAVVAITRGVETVPDRVRQAMILMVRHAYNGYGEMKPGHAAFRLLEEGIP